MGGDLAVYFEPAAVIVNTGAARPGSGVARPQSDVKRHSVSYLDGPKTARVIHTDGKEQDVALDSSAGW